MKKHAVSTLVILAAAFFFSAIPSLSQITLECDYTSPANQGEPMVYHWNISNRISPMKGFRMPVGEKPSINIVRPLGGKAKDGTKLIDEDTYRWDGSEYFYDWSPLKQQIDTVLKRASLYQLMIDNPPWAFQRGIDLKGAKEVETYGNAWPPNDPQAWSSYIQSMLEELIKTYGRAKVENWRYCIGREIGTAGHWQGTRMDFFEHYRNTEEAIRSVLPNAQVGTHFLWASSKNSFGPDFVRWCKHTNVRYDFIGVSYYPFYHRLKRVDMDHVYQVDFAPIKDIPEWNPSASLEIHEFALIKSMSSKGNSYESAPKAHQETFTAMLAKTMYDHGMTQIFRWGTGENNLSEQTFLHLKGNLYYHSSKRGKPTQAGNMVDAVFARDDSRTQFQIVAYNYNAKPDTKNGEQIKIMATVPAPPGSELQYRQAAYKEGSLNWSEWRNTKTTKVSGPKRSRLELSLLIAPFSFQRIEVRGSKEGTLTFATTKRTLTHRDTGTTLEAELIDLEEGNVICFVKGRNHLIPASSLSDEDREFLKRWAEEK